MANRHEGAHESIRREAEQFVDRRPDVSANPRDRGTQVEHRRANQQALGRPTIVVCVWQLALRVVRQDDRNAGDPTDYAANVSASTDGTFVGFSGGYGDYYVDLGPVDVTTCP